MIAQRSQLSVSATYQQNEDGRLRRQIAIVAGDPVEGDGAVVASAEALAAEPDVRERAVKRGEDSLDVSIGSN